MLFVISFYPQHKSKRRENINYHTKYHYSTRSEAHHKQDQSYFNHKNVLKILQITHKQRLSANTKRKRMNSARNKRKTGITKGNK